MGRKFKLLVEHARQIVQVCAGGERVLCGDSMKSLAVLEGEGGEGGGSGGYSVLVDRDGIIADIGKSDEIAAKYNREDIDNIIDATGKCVIPGLVDAHTHAVWAGDRVHEFAMKLAGASYMDVHRMGGGIHFTVKYTRAANEDTLLSLLLNRMRQMSQSGTTLVECKSGYGLDLENEVKMLRVIEEARKVVPMEISSTYCGAHAVPKEKTSAQATQDILDRQIPHIVSLVKAGQLQVDNIDVFCEKGVFDVVQSRAILQAGRDAGMQINFHGEELNRLHSAEMGAELGALAISHLEEVSPEGISAMARAGTVAVALPTTAYMLRLRPPPVRDMIEGGVAVALGSDFNPNAHCLAMPVVMNLACVVLHMSMPEALAASTINAAHALGQSAMHGSLERGKWGNLVLLGAPT
ncbi:hypothetical protein EGW08_003874 [Elysia chlorotica]|uniref:Probable imidazolonepropionase n=1 Tax=Elysia chlorotica TaxID=188477 RepID=A0A3S1ACJ1_ELYCH|nr:hypothetical protein EGW08_003874 [Elysia chlorotica]